MVFIIVFTTVIKRVKLSAATATANYATRRVERNYLAFKRAKISAFEFADIICPLLAPKTKDWPFCTP
ncbi:hypothetical protein A3742_12655 [Oleiphilus sp. HI0071]|nr:hypothetical protein A3737_18940 [Oleiphilus sp. HI0065]KZY80701.1 hypothetical protein A3742_12655 [Oleiphilus sp. HI0071]KZZ04993.1 hypothetical protein A3744_10085 [Oleiphilus sp. HI0073]KZZ16074.1 hypothetical protein A3751_15860 [Oleiphilus sp. HI0080]KZZ49260.1 hypothetical protein A3760_22065 [Oleiphilus sp. HI0122]